MTSHRSVGVCFYGLGMLQVETKSVTISVFKFGTMLRKISRWLLSEPPADLPSPIQFEPGIGGIAQEADASTAHVKIETGLNDFACPQEQLDGNIPKCSDDAANRVLELQHLHDYHESEYQGGVIGNFHPAAAYKEFDEEILHDFVSTDNLDLCPPSQASWQTQRDWRRRGLAQLYDQRKISSAQYGPLLERVIACASVMEANPQSGLDYEVSDFQISQHTIDPTPIPPCTEIAAAVVDKLQRTVEYSDDRFQYGVIGNHRPPHEFEDFDFTNLYEFEPSDHLDQSPPPHVDWSEQLNWRRRALRQLYAEHNICSIQYLRLLSRIYHIVKVAKQTEARRALAKQEQLAIVAGLLVEAVREEEETAAAAAEEVIAEEIIPPIATVVGVARAPSPQLPRSAPRRRPPSPVYSDPGEVATDQISDGESVVDDMFGGDEASQASTPGLQPQ